MELGNTHAASAEITTQVVGFSSFVDAASSRQIAVVTLMLTERPAEPDKNFLDHKNNEKKITKTMRRNKLGVKFVWFVAKQFFKLSIL